MIEWTVEFEGRQKLLSDIRSAEVLRLVEPLRHTLVKALGRTADPDSLDGLKVVICSEKENWGFRLEGSEPAVNHAISLLGTEVLVIPQSH
ncbi:hypothetical protein Rumeso_04068 [Rubellimicrobium mesophilum DSM 19309]|uniref:Uncharacterized protein n=1 Tax=Rubellimicrobium mesophilum DSM 19309 TaxID=442562 RepID=A0A017HJN2_9RHOB|nr:hypothetical protein [Rubellimicrobium mesophilum]EYD74383.1 hypothetical protein Rumeso_04068 [Rubellimicrobium mesophilum DSM 19309]